jgi:hypothetical protein
MSALNRRSILAGAAAVPIAALAGDAISAPASTDSRLLELERQAAAAENAAKEAGSIFCEAEKAMFAWKRRNPEPAMPKIKDAPQDAVDDWLRAFLAADDPEDFRAKNPSPNAPGIELLSRHNKNFSSWSERRRVALLNCRYEERKAFYEGLINHADAIRDEAASISAASIDGLRCKARMLSEADLIAVGESGLLAGSIIDELRGATDLTQV